MLALKASLFIALTLIVIGALYIRVRWRRSPRAYSAMIALSVGYFVAGALLGFWVLHLAEPRNPEAITLRTKDVAPASPSPTSASSREVGRGAALDYLPGKYSGKVVSVTDGDTIDVALDQNGLVQSIRLEGIDAPESAQSFGSQSTQHLSDLVSGKTVALECENERSYGRFICKVLLPNGEDVCLDQAKTGMAWHYKQYQDEQSTADRETYAAAECNAMKEKLGLWNDPHPVQPQDFRHATNSPLLYDANGCRRSSELTNGTVVGNARSHIFEWPECPYYSSISPNNQVPFLSPQAAEQAGYRPAHNCP
jgi:endonuclease YncB( thermonuclease family)